MQQLINRLNSSNVQSQLLNTLFKVETIMFDSECSSTLSQIDSDLAKTLTGIARGIEKEGLRVALDNRVAQTAHPALLGSTLTHPSITTDYSEALLEFITPKNESIDETIQYLTDLHRFTVSNIDDELIWPASMPCKLEGDESIPIAEYGSSNIGRLKHVYRQGLGLRYGRIMQSIAGIHYNFSLPDAFWQPYFAKMQKLESPCTAQEASLQDFKSAHYFSLIRNFRRYSWILAYLFGASPVLDKSFLNGRDHQLDAFSDQTLGLKYATSLRMSDLGYQNSAQEELHVCYNSLEDYVTTLAKAMKVKYSKYDEIGIKINGEYKQLNTNVLQIENEYYSDIRPKRVTRTAEKPIAALRDRGVEYIEVRILDINPFIAEGIDAEQSRFLDTFLLHCLLSQCPNTSDTACPEIKSNLRNVIMRGRDPELKVCQSGKTVPFKQAANDLLDALVEVAKLLDIAHGGHAYVDAVVAQKAKVEDSTLTPSGRIMTLLEEGTSFADLARDLAEEHKRYFQELDENTEFDEQLKVLSKESIDQQKVLEKSDALPFADFLEAYNKS